MAFGKKKRRRRGYREIDREHYQIGGGLEAPPSPPPGEDFASLVAKRLNRTEMAKPLWDQRLQEHWHELVGPQIAGNARPGPVEQGVLTVYVTSSAWLSELSRFGKSKMLARIQEKFGRSPIRSLRLALDPDLGTPPREAAEVAPLSGGRSGG